MTRFSIFVTIIFISLLGIVILFSFYPSHHDIKEKTESLETETPNLSRPKRSLEANKEEQPTSKPETTVIQNTKIPITAEKFERIKTYIFTEPDNPSLLPPDLSAREKEVITENKSRWQRDLELLENRKTKPDGINDYQNKCNEYNTQLNSIPSQIDNLKSSLLPLLTQLAAKRAEIENKESQLRASPDDKIRLQAEISQLKQEKSEIIGRIEDINVKIGNLEADRTYYQGMLASAKAFKHNLEITYKCSETEYRNSIVNSLHSLYQITSSAEE
ncbi:MAG: hypothetical protein Q8888_02585 [Vigna little leaf phytoplasma]|nr:hypothetical protein [Vigna little leaf phytoplasma]